MRANILRIAFATALFGLFVVPRAHADTRFSVQFGSPVVVAPAPVYVDGYYWQPGYYASVGYGRQWVSGYWVGRQYRNRWERDRWQRQGWERDRRERERDQRRFDDRDRGWRR